MEEGIVSLKFTLVNWEVQNMSIDDSAAKKTQIQESWN